MKIAKVKCYRLHPEGFENVNTLIELTAEDGSKGYGSTYTNYDLASAAMKLIEPVLLKEEVAPARISEKLHQMNYWLGRGGSVTHTISGVDIALWDIFGKQLGVSVSRLIGGRYRDKIRPYASLVFSNIKDIKPQVEKAAQQGFKGIKMGWGTIGRLDIKNDEKVVAECRCAAGDDVAIMIDAGGSEGFYGVTYKRALEMAKMMSQYNVEWYEEALRPDDIEGFIKLREHSPVRIASCEVLTRRQAFIPWIERGAVDIVQPDATKVGGLTEALRIAWHAYDYGIDYVPHGYNTAFGLATDLQLAAALPKAEWVEYITPSPLIEDITVRPLKMKDGWLIIPDTPGLGIEPDMEKVKFYSGVR